MDEVSEIRKLEPKPGDVIVVQVRFSKEAVEFADRVKDLVGEKVAVLVMTPGVSVELADRSVTAAALESFADLIDTWPADGPRLSPSVFSAMARERAAELRGDA